MKAEIIKELAIIKETSEITSKKIWSCAKRIEVQQSQKSKLESLKGPKTLI